MLPGSVELGEAGCPGNTLGFLIPYLLRGVGQAS